MARIIFALMILSACDAQAHDVRCDAPPYGDSVAAFKAYAKNFVALIQPAKILAAICRAKFDGADRTAFYNLGFTDEDFSIKSTTELGVQELIALKNLADKLPDSALQ